jgi:hypothetical protein
MVLNCKEFEDRLPELVDGGEWTPDLRAHGQSCPGCTGLVEDLRQISQDAPTLVAMHEPSPRVWQELRKSLIAEGIIRQQAKPGRLMDFFFRPNWRPRLIPLGAAAALVIFFVAYKSDDRRTNTVQIPPAVGSQANVAEMLDDDDVQLLNDVANRTPSLRSAYEVDLKSANAYISDAKENVAQRPDSDEAREDLMHAYNEKAMVYDMAMGRSSR